MVYNLKKVILPQRHREHRVYIEILDIKFSVCSVPLW